MVKIKIGARVFDTQGEVDQDRWLLLADYGVGRRQDATVESCFLTEWSGGSNRARAEEPTKDPIRMAMSEEYDQRKKELDLEFALKAEELKKEFDLRRRMIIEAYFQEKEEDFQKKDEFEMVAEDFPAVSDKESCLHGEDDFLVCPSQNGLGQRQPDLFFYEQPFSRRCHTGGQLVDAGKTCLFGVRLIASRHGLSIIFCVNMRRRIFNWKRVRKKRCDLTSPNGQMIPEISKKIRKSRKHYGWVLAVLSVVGKSGLRFHRMLRAGVLAPLACTQHAANLDSSCWLGGTG